MTLEKQIQIAVARADLLITRFGLAALIGLVLFAAILIVCAFRKTGHGGEERCEITAEEAPETGVADSCRAADVGETPKPGPQDDKRD